MLEDNGPAVPPATKQFSFVVFGTNALPPTGGTGADAWGRVLVDGTVSASFNTASATKNSTGEYTVVFTTAMPSENYSVTALADTADGDKNVTVTNQNQFGFVIKVKSLANTFVDCGFSYVVHATNAQLFDTVTVDQLMFNDGSTDFTGTQKFQDGLETTGGRVVLRSTESNKALWVRPADQAIAGFDTTTDAAILLTSSNCTLDANRNYSGFGVGQGFADGFTVPNDSSLRAFDANLNNDPDHDVYNFYASGTAQNYFQGLTRIKGGSTMDQGWVEISNNSNSPTLEVRRQGSKQSGINAFTITATANDPQTVYSISYSGQTAANFSLNTVGAAAITDACTTIKAFTPTAAGFSGHRFC